MSVNLPDKLKPSMAIAIDMLVNDPETKMKDVAEESGVAVSTLRRWLKDPEFVEVFYQKYMVTFGAKLPNILNSMIREAEAGNVQAGRLVLEHSTLMQHQMFALFGNELEKMNHYLEFLNDINDILTEKQSKRIGISPKIFKEKINNDWWLTAKKAVKENVADAIVSFLIV